MENVDIYVCVCFFYYYSFRINIPYSSCTPYAMIKAAQHYVVHNLGERECVKRRVIIPTDFNGACSSTS